MFGKCRSLPLMCLKYKVVHSILIPMMRTTIGFLRFSSFLPLECKVHMTIKRLFLGCNVGLKVKGEEVDKWFGNAKLIPKKTEEQPTMNQRNKNNTNTLTLTTNHSLQLIGNELTMPLFMHKLFLLFCLLLFFFLFQKFFLIFSFFKFFCKLNKMIKPKGILSQIINSQPNSYIQPKLEGSKVNLQCKCLLKKPIILKPPQWSSNTIPRQRWSDTP